MAKNEINWRALGIEHLQRAYSKSYEDARKQWENIYRKALRQVRKQGLFNKDFNVSREVYASRVWGDKGTGLFSITPSGKGTGSIVEFNVGLGPITDIEKAYVKERFKGMADTFKPVKEFLNAYLDNEIDYDMFLDLVETYKNTLPDYWKYKD